MHAGFTGLESGDLMLCVRTTARPPRFSSQRQSVTSLSCGKSSSRSLVIGSSSFY